MPDLAFIHPLLVRNPLPSDRLNAAVKQAATACALVDHALAVLLRQPSLGEALPTLARHEEQAERRAHHWQESLLPSLTTCMNGVGHFASQFNHALGSLQFAAADVDVDPSARRRLYDGLQLHRSACAAQLAITRRVVIAVDTFRCTYARDFVAFVVDVDAARASLGKDPAARLAFRQQVDERQRVTGDAMAAVASVISALASVENAWSMLVSHFETLETQLADGELNSPMLQARLNATRQDWSSLAGIADRPPPLRGQAVAAASPPMDIEAAAAVPALQAVSAFRSAAIGDGTGAIAGAIALIDSLAMGLAEFPTPDGNGVLAVVHHIEAVKQLAHAWPERARPALVGALDELKTFSDGFVREDAARLQQAFAGTGAGDGAAREEAVQLVAGLMRRLAALGSTFEAVSKEMGDYLSHMAGVSAKLNADTELVTDRLRAEHEQAQVLALKAIQLREQVTATSERKRWHWLLGPLGAIVNHEIEVLSGNLRGVSNQLNEVRAAQASTMDDAAYLQSLLPALSTYLTGMDQVGAGIALAMTGTRTLRAQLGELKNAMLVAPGSWSSASAQLATALDGWRAISGQIGQLPPA
jgi:hypothetical protein